jgi:hypothetical protein
MNLLNARAIAARSITIRDRVVRIRREVASGPTRWLLGFAAWLLIGQIVLFLALLGRIIEFGTYIEMHLFCCFALMCYLAWYRCTLDGRSLVALQIVGWSALAGPFGTFVAIALTMPRRTAGADSQIVPDALTNRFTKYRSATERIERMHTVLLDRRARLQDACRVRPLIDVIVEGSTSEKLEALSVAYRKYEAKLAALLRRALQDHDTSVRVLAATVIAKLQTTYGRKIGECQNRVASDPEVAHGWYQLAESRLAYAESDLLEGVRARAEIESAIGELSRAVDLDPANAACVTRLHRARRLIAYGGRR